MSPHCRHLPLTSRIVNRVLEGLEGRNGGAETEIRGKLVVLDLEPSLRLKYVCPV